MNHPENKKPSGLGLDRLKNDRINSNNEPKILKSNNPKNHNSDK